MSLQSIYSKIPFNLSIIKVENSSKEYWISHQKEKASYGTLSDELVNIFRKPAPWLKGQKDLRGDTWALKNVDSSIELGETLGAIGPNGAGKATLSKIWLRISLGLAN